MPDPDENPRARKPLDRDNLPEEFTPEFLSALSPRDLIWLESEADLTPRQRETFTAWSGDRFQAFDQVGASTRRMMESFRLPEGTFSGFKLPEGTLGKWFRSTLPQRDPLGDDIQMSVRALNDLTGPPRTAQYRANRQHNEQQQSLRQLYEVNEAMRDLMLQLVTRTEQQHEEAKRQQLAAERQKTTNWALAVIAVASMAGTFATVSSMNNFWFALIATAIAAGILYVVMH